MNRILYLIVFIGCRLSLMAQDITVVEYFFDTDPGYGNGTSVSLSQAPSITNLSFSINISSQSDGFHTLFIRAKDANNNWSAAYSRPFYKLSVAAVTAAPNINKIEYFFDTDPGFGAGTDVPVTPAVSITDQNFTVPINSAADGFHTLFIRTRDANNNWSAAYSRPFYKLSTAAIAAAPNLNKLEYFIDADPGYGAGVNVPISTGVAVSALNVPIAVTAIAEGSHIITFRARDGNNNWSVVAVQNFSKCNHPGTTINAATSLTNSGFTASWADVPGSISYQLDVSTDNFATFVSGYNSRVITAPALSSVVTGLAQATMYQYRVRAVASCASVQSNVVSFTTLATPPSSQPTNLLFSSVTSSSFTAFFTAPSTVPTGYLVIRKVGSASAFVPATNTTYTVGQNIGDGVVASVSNSTILNETSLTPDTQYFYRVFAYNTFNGQTSYLTTSPLQNNVRTVALEPTAQPTNIQFTSVTDVGLTLSYTAAGGNPTGYLVLRRVGSTPTSVPVDGTTYTTTVGTDAVVYNGPATSFSQTGLTQNTNYFYAVYAYNGSGTAINYLTTAPLQGSQLTPITPPASSPTNLVFSSITPTSITVSYTAATGSPSGYLVVRKVGSSSTFVPQTNVAYASGQTLTDGVVAHVGGALSFVDSGLAPSTTYFYDIFAYNQTGALIGYRTTSPLEGSQTTFTAEPTAQPSGLSFSSTTSTSHSISFFAVAPAPTGYLALRKAGSAPTGLPADGTAYSLGATVGDATVAYVGSSLAFTDNGLLSGTNYFYQIFSYNGSGAATNYLVTVNASNSGSKITIPAKPALPTASSPGQNQFTINWTAVVGADNYRLDVSKDNFVTRISGFDDLTVSALTQAVTGLETGTAYKFRLRAVNTSGTSINSDEVQQFTIPASPVLSSATSVGQFGFTANWTAVTGATNYFIDVSQASDFSTFAPGYQNKQLAAVSSEMVTGLAAGNTYFYRVRSRNDGGTSPSSSVVSQLMVPATPVGLDATNQQPNSFKANWQPAQGATSYLLDVSLASSNFSPSLPSYTNKPIAVGTSDIVSGLTPNTEYRYRIRAVNATDTSPSSIPIPVSTTAQPTGFPLQLSNLTFSSSFTTAPASISVDATGGTPGYSVVFYNRKITGSTFTSLPMTSTSTNYKASIDASMFDEIGMEFYFKVTDAVGDARETTKNYIYAAVPATGQKIPFSKFGGTKESYELFSIPYELTKNGTDEIFDELGAINKSKWRLLRYQNGRNVDVGAGLTSIEPGKGYWFNRKENIEVSFTNGTVTKANQVTPFKMSLESGWNQIGNPFPFNIDWDDIVALSPRNAEISKLKVFNPQQFTLTDESNSLRAWSGGFVFNASSQRIELDLPVTLKNTAGGRKATDEPITSNLGVPSWFVPLTIIQDGIVNHEAGFGMHLDASLSRDTYDEMVVPRFLNYLELYTIHNDFFSPWFAKDVIPSAQNHTWDFFFESNLQGNVTIKWDNESLGVNSAKLFLFDPVAGVLVDMKESNQYQFESRSAKLLRIFFANNENEILPDVETLTSAWPNPFTKETNISFLVKDQQSKVVISVFDMFGKELNLLANNEYKPGIYTVQWNGKDLNEQEVAIGLYIIQLEVNGRKYSKRSMKR
jgi:Fibronectin type III domain